ncbi:MIR motif-containing protein [Gautieria morchelliformis]|nr:MIR motif-containing protein [Gautieria morchelliformis]
MLTSDLVQRFPFGIGTHKVDIFIHTHNYPGGSNQQQITLYPHHNTNNNWLIVNATEGGTSFSVDFSNVPFEPVTAGMRIRLHHIMTEKQLHSHDVHPPISEVDFQNEVSAYGFLGFMGDANDDWLLRSMKETSVTGRVQCQTLKTDHSVIGATRIVSPPWIFNLVTPKVVESTVIEFS